MKLLLVEDNAELASWLARLLKAEDFVVDWAPDGERALVLLGTQIYDALVIDMNLPGMSGKSLLARVRRTSDVPALILTASASTEDKLACFSTGADDYVTKPFDMREFVARIKALMRRNASAGGGAVTSCGDLSYAFDTRAFFLRGEPLLLRRREHTVLEALMLRQGTIVAKSQLVGSVFGIDEDASLDAIDIYVHRLRKRLGTSSAKIMTLRGLGYILKVQSLSPPPP